MFEREIPIDLNYATFAATLGELNESDRALAVNRVRQLLSASKMKDPNIGSESALADEMTAFRADIAGQVIGELLRAGKIKRVILRSE